MDSRIKKLLDSNVETLKEAIEMHGVEDKFSKYAFYRVRGIVDAYYVIDAFDDGVQEYYDNLINEIIGEVD